MMRSVEFQKFIDLVTFDQSLVKIEQNIKKSQEEQQSLLTNLARVQADFQDITLIKIKARKAVDEKELYMKILDTKEADLKKKLDLISNQKEYKSLQKELATLHADRTRHEQELLQLWNRFDTLEKNYESQEKLYNEHVAKLMQALDKNKEDVQQLHDQLELFNTQRLEKQQNIPQEWLDMYVNMKGRVANPVIPVAYDACDACFYSVTPRDLQMLRQNKLLQCKDCYRLLYLQDQN